MSFNSKTKASEIAVSSKPVSKIQDLAALVKMRLNLTVVFSAIMAFLIAADGNFTLIHLFLLGTGGFLITGASNALNQVLEKDYDALMKRTANRPIAAGRMDVNEGLMLAGLMCTGGTFLLAAFNVWAAFFGMLAMVSYAFIYTPLKRLSPIAVTVGAFPGALPMAIGVVAFDGYISLLAVGLFMVQFLWQFPHFAAIGWLGSEDYQKAGYKFVVSPKGGKDRSAGITSMIYAFALIPTVFIPYCAGETGFYSALFGVVLSIAYAWFGFNLYKKNNRKAALQLMFSSFFYLPLILFAYLIDKV